MISVIVAVDKDNLIGQDNSLPWHYAKDLQYFRKQTLNKTLLMGENTYYSIIVKFNKPLDKRKSVVATLNNLKSDFESVEFTSDPFEYVKNFPKDQELMIIGGKSMYEQFFPYMDRFYLTIINKSHEGNVYLNMPNLDNFRLISEKEEDILTFKIYERRY